MATTSVCTSVGTRAGVTMLRVGQCVMRVEFFKEREREREVGTERGKQVRIRLYRSFFPIRVALRLIERNC